MSAEADPNGTLATPRVARPGDAAGILAVLEAAFRRWPYAQVDVPPLVYLRWKLASHPGAPGLQFVSELDGRIVATQLGWAVPVKVRDRSLLAMHGVDHAVLPDLQERGVFRELRAFRAERLATAVDLQMGHTHHSAMRHVWSRELDRPLGNPIERLVRPLALVPPLRAMRPRELARHPSLVVRSAVRRRPSGGASGLTVVRSPSIDARFERLWAAAREPFDFAVERTPEWLEWRYGRPDAGGFTILAAEEGEEIQGYVAFRVAGDRGLIADLLGPPGRPDVVGELVAAACRDLRTGGASSVECWLPRRHPYGDVVRRAGFVGRGEGLVLGFYALRVAEEELAFLRSEDARIHFTLGDTDLV